LQSERKHQAIRRRLSSRLSQSRTGFQLALFWSTILRGYIHDAGVKPISQQHPNRLRCEPTVSAIREVAEATVLERASVQNVPAPHCTTTVPTMPGWMAQ
jgi:hypothetical protein